MPIPREHGAWAMVFAPVWSVIAIIGSWNTGLFLFLIALTAAFFLKEPLKQWIRLRRFPEQRVSLLRWLVFYSVLAVFPAVCLIWISQLWSLVWFALIIVILFVAQLFLLYYRLERQTYSELLAVAGLTLSGPACYLVLTGRLDVRAWLIWALHALFFSSSVFYLKMRVSRFAAKKHKETLKKVCAGYHGILVLILWGLAWWKIIPWVVVVGFVPIFLRSIYSMYKKDFRLNLTRIGLAEIVYTMIFMITIIESYR